MRFVAQDIAGERGGETVFRAISFALGPGDAMIVTGPNGSGKSTLLRVLAGLLPLAAGALRIEEGGEDCPTIASACAYLGHQNAMKPSLTVTENLSFWREFLGNGAGGESLSPDAALEAAGLGDLGHLPFGYLSTGQRRRAAIARLMMSPRPVWLLDEPTAGLDRASELRFVGQMRAHVEGGGILIAATHLPLGLDGVVTLHMAGRE